MEFRVILLHKLCCSCSELRGEWVASAARATVLGEMSAVGTESVGPKHKLPIIRDSCLRRRQQDLSRPLLALRSSTITLGVPALLLCPAAAAGPWTRFTNLPARGTAGLCFWQGKGNTKSRPHKTTLMDCCHSLVDLTAREWLLVARNRSLLWARRQLTLFVDYLSRV